MSKVENKWLLQDLIELTVANFYAYDKKSGVEYFTGTLKTHELDIKGDTTKVKAGQNNDIFYVIPQSKEPSLKITDVFSRQDILALKYGDNIHNVGNALVDARHMPRNYTLKSDGTSLYIQLTQTPKAGEEVKVYNNTTKRMIDSSKVVVDATNKKKYVISEAGLNEGDTVFVTGFKYQAKASDMYSDITSDSKMPELEVVIEVPVFDQSCMDIVMYKQYIFPRAQMNSSVTNKAESEKKEVNDDTTLDILKDSSVDYLGRIIYIYPEDPNQVNDLVATSSTATKADLTFSVPTDATAVTLKYKLSTDSSYSDVATSGSTGVRISGALTSASTSATVSGLTTASTYDFKLAYTVDSDAYESNIATVLIP